MVINMKTDELVALGQKYLMNTYDRLPLALVRGEGTRVWDNEGKEYLDFVMGIAVTSLGHAHPKVVQAVREQAARIIHTSNLYWIEPQIELARKLAEHSFADKVFFCNSGAEANEGAIKLARKYTKARYGAHKGQIISLQNSFHGRTLAALTATGQTKYQKGFDPLMPGFSYIPLNDGEALRQALNEETAALILEPIQGEGGVRPLDPGFLRLARQLCDERQALLIFDEVQCGLGRTGMLFAYQGTDVVPDIMTLAKALGNGAPIGAFLAKDEVAGAFQPGDHGTTFGGNPLVTAAGCAVLDQLTAPGFLDDVAGRAAYFRQRLQETADRCGLKAQVRGQGFILGLPVGEAGGAIVNSCREQGLLVNCVGGTTLRFLPPLTVSRAEIDQAVLLLEKSLRQQFNDPQK